jgi:hypothetical protein
MLSNLPRLFKKNNNQGQPPKQRKSEDITKPVQRAPKMLSSDLQALYGDIDLKQCGDRSYTYANDRSHLCNALGIKTVLRVGPKTARANNNSLGIVDEVRAKQTRDLHLFVYICTSADAAIAKNDRMTSSSFLVAEPSRTDLREEAACVLDVCVNPGSKPIAHLFRLCFHPFVH